MSLAYFIVPEGPVPGLDCMVNGKALAHASSGLINRICREAGVRPLVDFFSQNPAEALAFCEDAGIVLPPDVALSAETWFTAADGLRTVRALLARANELAAAGPADYASHMEGDLQEFQDVLAALERANVRWHLAVDC